ncbi:hypothetical protein GOP47_0000652 [Adiantum capillus-veneris]|uniref:Uncharacterized protein n=1 Tax=Adiantum capillus-veneris TaxID=13818 RepID=A0A9D4VFD5_ADICA|nr:hypothetical protein GOP47_0000652 [Adiantum capillus-veneris]
MRKGLWSPDEDEKLRNCIALHTSGSWSDIARKAGLQRCGKSCRRRWMNHLRPDLKREKFTLEEVKLVTKLHQTLGNKWSEIATYLVGRTDNDVKNLWNTQIKRQLKNGQYDPISKSTSRQFNGFLFGMDSTFEKMEHPYIEMAMQPRDDCSAKKTQLMANSLSPLSTYALELNLQHNLEDVNQIHVDDINKGTSSLFTSKAYTNEDAHVTTISQYARQGEDPFCCLLDECDITGNIGEYVPKLDECKSQISPNESKYSNIHPHMSVSHASWEGPGSSNDSRSSTGTINLGDDTSSVCKPSLCELQYQLQSQEALGNHDHNQYLKDDDNDVSSLSRRESWSSTSCEQWALEALIGYCDAYTKTTWP